MVVVKVVVVVVKVAMVLLVLSNTLVLLLEVAIIFIFIIIIIITIINITTLDETQPIPDPDGDDGWYFAKTGPSGNQKISWWSYFNTPLVTDPLINPGPIQYQNLDSMWAIVNYHKECDPEFPYLILYTKKTGLVCPAGTSGIPGGFYDQRLAFLSPGCQGLTGEVLIYTGVNPDVHPEVSARLALTTVVTGGCTGDVPPTAEILRMGLDTASNFAQGNNQAGEITVEGFGYELFNNNVVDDGNFQLTFASGKKTSGKRNRI